MFAGSLKTVEPNDLGRQQFFDYQTKGIKPENPDKYYEKLKDGKKWFDWQVSEYHQSYVKGTDGWFGLIQLWVDWKGERYLLPHLLKWRKDIVGEELPWWITNEDLELEDVFEIRNKKEI